MIKGRYVALVEINIHVDAAEGLLPMEQIRQNVTGGALTNAIRAEIADIFDSGTVDVNVTQQLADVYEVEQDVDVHE